MRLCILNSIMDIVCYTLSCRTIKGRHFNDSRHLIFIINIALNFIGIYFTCYSHYLFIYLIYVFKGLAFSYIHK